MKKYECLNESPKGVALWITHKSGRGASREWISTDPFKVGQTEQCRGGIKRTTS